MDFQLFLERKKAILDGQSVNLMPNSIIIQIIVMGKIHLPDGHSARMKNIKTKK